MSDQNAQLTSKQIREVLHKILNLPLPKDWVKKPVCSRETAWSLTPRQWQVFILLALGWSNQEIATALEISIKTVASHRGDVLEKLGIRRSREIILIALQLEVIDREGNVLVPAWAEWKPEEEP